MESQKKRSPQQELQGIIKLFHSTVNKYRQAEPRWVRIALLQLIQDGLSGLRHYIEEPGHKASWSSPRVRMSIDVGWRWTQNRQFGELITFDIQEHELNDRLALANRVRNYFKPHLRICALQAVTDGVVTGKRGGKIWSLLPVQDIPALQELSDEDRTMFLEFIYQPRRIDGKMTSLRDRPFACPGFDEFFINPIDLTFNFESGDLSVEGTIEWAFFPLQVDSQQEYGCYPIEIGISFEEGANPKQLPNETHDLFWNHLYSVCINRIESERQLQTGDAVSTIVGQLGRSDILPEVQVQLNKQLETKGEILVRIPTIPGESESITSYVTGYAMQLKGKITAARDWPDPPSISPPSVFKKKPGAPATAAARRKILRSVIPDVSAFRDSKSRQKLCDAFVNQHTPIPPKKGQQSTPLSWPNILGCNGARFDPNHRVIKILKRDLNRR